MIGDYDRGKRRLSLSMAKHLAEILHINVAGIGSGSMVMALVNHLVGNRPTPGCETQVDNQ
jgi:hypothetical protein